MSARALSPPRSCQATIVAIVSGTDGHNNTPRPFAQSTPFGPKIRPASDANTDATANRMSVARTHWRVRSDCVRSLRIAPAAHNVSTNAT
jgi:hypothetical protein